MNTTTTETYEYRLFPEAPIGPNAEFSKTLSAKTGNSILVETGEFFGRLWSSETLISSTTGVPTREAARRKLGDWGSDCANPRHVGDSRKFGASCAS